MALPTEMKAWRLSAFGEGGDPADAISSKLTLETIPVPEPGEGSVLVKVEFASVNPLDWKIFSGKLQDAFPTTFPHTPGLDVAGVVVKLGEGVSNVAAGNKVVAMIASTSGSFAEYAIVRANTLSKIDGLIASDVVGLPLAGQTAYQAIFTGQGEALGGGGLGSLQAGQKLLVLGGAAATGCMAVQMAKSIGAYVATTASNNKMPDGTTKIDYMKKMGADQVIDYKSADWSDVLAGKDFDLIFDCAGDAADWPKASKVLKRKGLFASIANFEAHSNADYSFKAFLLNPNSTDLDKLVAMVRDNKLVVPYADMLPFSKVPQALLDSMTKRPAGKICVNVAGPSAKLIFSRHGESEWNVAGKFTGWVDVDLSEKGVGEAKSAGELLKEAGVQLDKCYTSVLKRAIKTCNLALEHSDQLHVPQVKSWRLNERMYGGLTGLDKKETVVKHGAEQVQIWRRSFDLPPPDIADDSEYHPKLEAKYKLLDQSEIPKTESLKTVIERVMPFWESTIIPDLKAGKTVFVCAHGNSIRAIVKYLENIPDDVIPGLEIPTGTPLVYELDAELKPVPSDLAIAPLTAGRYLGDAEKIKLAAEAVKNQTRVS